jgi:hypothetical protein
MTKAVGASLRTGLLLAVALAFTGSAAAQTCADAAAQVKNVYREELQDVKVPGKPTTQVVRKYRSAKLRDILTVEVGNIQSLIQEAECRGKDIVLYLDDRPLTDVVAFPPSNPKQNLLRFPLQRTEASRDVWTYILGRPGFDPRPTKVSVGVQDRFAIPVASARTSTIDLQVIPTGWFLFWLALFLIFLVGFWYLARRTDVIRDSVPLPGEGARRPYSLARTQASWWFFLVLAAYMLIGMITGDFSTSITPTVLILMGISAGTVVGSAFVDASKTTPQRASQQAATRQALTAEVAQLQGSAQAATAAVQQNPADPNAAAALASVQAALADKESQLRKLRNESEHFLQDILSDANGVSFHRFQMLAWTIVLGIIFVGQVYKALAMPEFNTTLLSLMGISAGTYLGLKIPEETTG